MPSKTGWSVRSESPGIGSERIGIALRLASDRIDRFRQRPLIVIGLCLLDLDARRAGQEHLAGPAVAGGDRPAHVGVIASKIGEEIGVSRTGGRLAGGRPSVEFCHRISPGRETHVGIRTPEVEQEIGPGARAVEHQQKVARGITGKRPRWVRRYSGHGHGQARSSGRRCRGRFEPPGLLKLS